MRLLWVGVGFGPPAARLTVSSIERGVIVTGDLTHGNIKDYDLCIHMKISNISQNVYIYCAL